MDLPVSLSASPVPQKPLLFREGQRVRVCYRVFDATIQRHDGFYPNNGDNVWVVKLDGVDGYQVASDAQIFPARKG